MYINPLPKGLSAYQGCFPFIEDTRPSRLILLDSVTLKTFGF